MKNRFYKQLLGMLALFWALSSCTAFAQTESTPATKPLSAPVLESSAQKRVSPLEEVHTAIVGSIKIDLQYGSPAVKQRKIWGELVPYDKVWRTGANEATTFSVDKDVLINGEKLPAGRYSLFTIPSQNEWTIIFNSVPDQWGAYNYNAEKDVLRVQVKPNVKDELTEHLIIKVEDDGKVAIIWEHLEVPFMVKKAE